MADTKPTITPVHKTSYEAFSMQDKVRSEILDLKREAVLALQAVNVVEMKNRGRIGENEPRAIMFKATTLSLYYTLKDKLRYPKDNKPFERLKLLEPYACGERSQSELSVKVMKEFFALMCTFIEVDGITKFEREKDEINPTHIIAKRASGVVHLAWLRENNGDVESH